MVDTCPFCKIPYLVSNKDIPMVLRRHYYQEHLNEGCYPLVKKAIQKILTSMVDVQREFIA